jgi:hypothetical protein
VTRVLRALVPSARRPWLDAALAESITVEPGDRRRWRIGVALFVARQVSRRFAVALAMTVPLVLTALLVGWLDLQIEPTSVSLLLIVSTGALGGYLFRRTWWLPGLILGSSISLTSATIRIFHLSVTGEHPATTSTTAIAVLLVLCVPALGASWAGATVRRRTANGAAPTV